MSISFSEGRLCVEGATASPASETYITRNPNSLSGDYSFIEPETRYRAHKIVGVGMGNAFEVEVSGQRIYIPLSATNSKDSPLSTDHSYTTSSCKHSSQMIDPSELALP